MNFSNFSGEGVVLTEFGQVFNPIEIDNFLIVSYVICFIWGFPLNMTIAVTIIRFRRFHRKPRNIFLLGIIFSHLTFFIPLISKFIYSAIYLEESLCHVYISVVGVPQGLLLVNTLLALIDRYLAINHPLVHRQKMTGRLAWILVICSSIFIVFSFKFVYIFRLAPLRCEVLILHTQIILIGLTILFVLSTAFNFILHRQTKNFLGETRTICPSANRRHVAPLDGHQMEEIELAVIGNNSSNAAVSSTPVAGDNPAVDGLISIHVNRRQLSQMGMNATRCLISGVTSIVVTALPPTIFVSSFLACRMISQTECSHFNWLASYMIELGIINILYNPWIYLTRNKELRTAITCQCQVCRF